MLLQYALYVINKWIRTQDHAKSYCAADRICPCATQTPVALQLQRGGGGVDERQYFKLFTRPLLLFTVGLRLYGGENKNDVFCLFFLAPVK